MEYALIERLRLDFSISFMCRYFKVSYSGYYRWRKRPTSKRSRKEGRLELEILAAHKRTRGTCGPERLQKDLAKHGVKVGIHRIKRIRKNLVSVVSKKGSLKLLLIQIIPYPWPLIY